jgi:hypothetical protein
MATDEQIKNGLIWYKEAHNIIINLSKSYKIEAFKVASVMSALSPRNKWKQNILDTEKVCKAWNENLKPEDIKVCTFHSNKFKAFAILNDKVSITDKSLKTFNFVNNIAFLDPNSVTIDIWHLRASFNKIIKINSASIGRMAYSQIKKLTLKKALKIGIKAYQYQAIIWLSTQNNLINK